MKGVIAIGELAASRLFGPHAASAFQRPYSPRTALDSERHVYRRSPCLLGHGGRWPVLFTRGFGSPSLAYSGQFHLGSGDLCDAAGADTFSRAGRLHRVHPERLCGRVSVLRIPISTAAWLADLRIVDRTHPLIRWVFVVIGSWMAFEGVLKKPLISGLAGVTLLTGAVVYRTRSRH